tara:strand:- start:442 stop:735 length:294 start_codon:yes stop_codon:yes gene_type:complete
MGAARSKRYGVKKEDLKEMSDREKFAHEVHAKAKREGRKGTAEVRERLVDARGYPEWTKGGRKTRKRRRKRKRTKRSRKSRRRRRRRSRRRKSRRRK